MQLFPLLILGGYIFALVISTIYSGRRESEQEYMIGGRKVSSFGLMTSVVGNLRDGAGIAAWVILSAYFGFGALWLTVGLAAGLALLGIWAPRVRQLAGEHDYVSVTELIADSVGRKTARLSSLIIAGTALLYAASQLFVAGTLSSSLFGVSPQTAILLVAVIVTAYLILGGYKATILTGIVQWFILLFILFIPFILLKGNSPTIDPTTFINIDPPLALGFVGLSFLVAVSSADIWQLIFSSRSGTSARKGLLQSIPIYFLISIGMILFGIALMIFLGPNTKPETAFFDIFTSSQIPEYIRSLVSVFVLAAIMSTLDSQVFLFTSTLVKEFKPKMVSNGIKLETITKYGIGIMMFALVLIATQIGNLVQFLFSAVTLGTILVPLFIYTMVKRKFTICDPHWMIALLIGVVVYILMFIQGSFENVALTMIPALVTSGVLFVFWILKQSKVRI